MHFDSITELRISLGYDMEYGIMGTFKLHSE